MARNRSKRTVARRPEVTTARLSKHEANGLFVIISNIYNVYLKLEIELSLWLFTSSSFEGESNVKIFVVVE